MLNDDILTAIDMVDSSTTTDIRFESTENLSKQKYVSSANKVGNILFLLNNRFQVFIIIGGIKVSTYSTLYYDTWNCCFFNDYLNSSPTRYKVRLRHYHNQNRTLFEVKRNVATKRLRFKKRVEIESINHFRTPETETLLKEATGVSFDQISPILECRFRRIVLVAKDGKQRVSIDMDPVFTNKRTGVSIGVPELVIIETKNYAGEGDYFAECVPAEYASKSDISRYMTGMLVTNPSTRRSTPESTQNLEKQSYGK